MLSAPRKEIFNPDDMSKWLKSEAYQVCRFSVQHKITVLKTNVLIIHTGIHGIHSCH